MSMHLLQRSFRQEKNISGLLLLHLQWTFRLILLCSRFLNFPFFSRMSASIPAACSLLQTFLRLLNVISSDWFEWIRWFCSFFCYCYAPSPRLTNARNECGSWQTQSIVSFAPLSAYHSMHFSSSRTPHTDAFYKAIFGSERVAQLFTKRDDGILMIRKEKSGFESGTTTLF